MKMEMKAMIDEIQSLKYMSQDMKSKQTREIVMFYLTHYCISELDINILQKAARCEYTIWDKRK